MQIRLRCDRFVRCIYLPQPLTTTAFVQIDFSQVWERQYSFVSFRLYARKPCPPHPSPALCACRSHGCFSFMCPATTKQHHVTMILSNSCLPMRVEELQPCYPTRCFMCTENPGRIFMCASEPPLSHPIRFYLHAKTAEASH